MRGLTRNLFRKTVLAGEYLESLVRSPALRRDFDDVDTFLLFLGYPRSGHSLVGSLMDAHPNMILAHEANALKAIRYGFGRTQLFTWLLRKSQRFTAAGRSYTGYSYSVPGQWQGRYRHIEAIGDKHGNFTVEILARRPELLEKARQRVQCPIRFIHVTRNPFDNIATIFRREKYDLEGAVEYYFGLVDDVASFTAQLPPEDVWLVRHEDLIASPARVIEDWCRFVGVEPYPDYVEDAAAIVFDSPHRSRLDVEWPESLIKTVNQRKNAVPFLRDYTFD